MSSDIFSTEAGNEGPPAPMVRDGNDLALPRIVSTMEQTRRRYTLRKKVEKRIADSAIPGKNIAKKIADKARGIVRRKHAMNKRERQLALDLLCQMASLGMTIRANASLAQEFISSARTLQRAYRKHLAARRLQGIHALANDVAEPHMKKDFEEQGFKVQQNNDFSSDECPDDAQIYTSLTYSLYSAATSSESDSEFSLSDYSDSETESDSESDSSDEDESELDDADEPMVGDSISESSMVGDSMPEPGVVGNSLPSEPTACGDISDEWMFNDSSILYESQDALWPTSRRRALLKNMRQIRHACRAIGLSRKLIKQDSVEYGVESDFRLVSFPPINKEIGDVNKTFKSGDSYIITGEKPAASATDDDEKAPSASSQSGITRNKSMRLGLTVRVSSFKASKAGSSKPLAAEAKAISTGITEPQATGFGITLASYKKNSETSSSKPDALILEPGVTIEHTAPLGSKTPSGQAHGLNAVSAAEAQASAGSKAPSSNKSEKRVKIAGDPLSSSTERQATQRSRPQSLLMPLDDAPQVVTGPLCLNGRSTEIKAVRERSSRNNKSTTKLKPTRSKNCYECRNGYDSSKAAPDSTIVSALLLARGDAAQLSGKMPAYLQQRMATDNGCSSSLQPQRALPVKMPHSDIGEHSSKSPARARPLARLWHTGTSGEPSSTLRPERTLPSLSATGAEPSPTLRTERSLPRVSRSLPKLGKSSLPLESSVQSSQDRPTEGITSLGRTSLNDLPETIMARHQDGRAKGPWSEAAADNKKLPPVKGDGDEWPWPWPSSSQPNKKRAQPPKLEHSERGPLRLSSINQRKRTSKTTPGDSSDNHNNQFARLFQHAHTAVRRPGRQNAAAVTQGNESQPQEGACHKQQHRRGPKPVRSSPALVH